MHYFGTENQRKGDYWYDRGDYEKALEYYNAALDTLRRNTTARDTKIYYPLAYALLEVAITQAVSLSKINLKNSISKFVEEIKHEFNANFSEAENIYTNSLTKEHQELITVRLKLSKVVFFDQMSALYWNRADYLSRVQKEEVTEQFDILDDALTHLQKAREFANQLNQLNQLNDKQRNMNEFDAFEADINLKLSQVCVSIVNDEDSKLDTYYLIGFLKKAVDYNREAFALIDMKGHNTKLQEVNKQYLQINEQLFNLTGDATYNSIIKNDTTRYKLSTSSLLITHGTFRPISDTETEVHESDSDDSMKLVN